MKILRNNWLSFSLLFLVVVWLGWYGIHKGNSLLSNESKSLMTTREITALAQCLTDKGFKLYGTFWCSHCQEQKAMFGDASKYINYIECSGQDGTSQTAACAKAKITMYPTWELPDGQRLPGMMTLDNLVNVSGCKVS